MSRMIREHLRDFLAIIALMVAGVATTLVILGNQAGEFPGWVPLLGKDRFELKAEFSTAQAVTPGQGQSVDIAGIRVGDVTGADLVNGNAVVTMEVENEYADLITDDSSLLLRPKTGLNDMVIEVAPGVSPEVVEEGATIPLASSQPNVSPDEVLASLDADTQAFLKLLLAGGGEALGGDRGRKLSGALRRFEPLGRDIAKINGRLAQRRDSISRAIHNFRLVSEEIGDKDRELITFVDASNAVLGSFANQEASIREALQELPGALEETNLALRSANRLALESAPALRDSLPGARALAPALRALRPFLRQTVAPIRDQIRPFARSVHAPVYHLRQVSKGLGKSVPGLKVGFSRLNEGLNALAFNPSGAQEGYLFYVPWLNHNLTNLYFQDAHGPLRRGLVQTTCATISLAGSTVFPTRPYLLSLAGLTGVPRAEDIC